MSRITTNNIDDEETKKMGVIKFLQKCPQNTTNATLLKNSKYKNSMFTKTEWFNVLDKLLKKKITQ